MENAGQSDDRIASTFDAIRGIAGDRDVDSGAEILYPSTKKPSFLGNLLLSTWRTYPMDLQANFSRICSTEENGNPFYV